MNKKLTKIWGVGLVLVLLVSMFGLAVPASAGTLSWSVKTNADIPSTTNEVLALGSSLLDMAVSSDGQTIYVVADISGADKLFKSTNGGDTWSEVSDAAVKLPTTLTRVAIAPDDTNIVVIQGGTSVYASTNAGSTFNTLGTVTSSASGSGTVNTIYDLAISSLSGSERYIAVAGQQSGADAAALYYFNLGSSAPQWKDALSADFTGSQPSANATMDKIVAVAFSPNFASDQVITAVSEETGGALDATGFVRYHVASFNQKAWDTTEFGTPVSLETSTANATLTVTVADISIDPAYLGGDDTTRNVFVGASILAAGVEAGGVYRLKNTTLRQEKDGTGINSVAWDGVNIAAGAYATNDVFRSADALVSSPTYSTSRGLKEIGVDDSGNDAVLVRWAGDTLVGVKQGAASSFARSTDSGKTWSEIALMDTALTTMMDFGVTPDGSIQYLLTNDSAETSLFLRSTSNWQRIFVVAHTTTADWIVRVAMGDPSAVYIADVGGTTMYYTNDSGLEKWTQRTSRYTIADMAVQDADVAYVANQDNDEVSKTTNGGFTWGTDVDTKSGGGTGVTLTLIGEDQILIGTTTGYVAYSSDGNTSWTKVATQLSVSGKAHATASGLAAGDFIYAATQGTASKVERWEIGQSETSWKDLAAPTPATYSVYGLALVEGALFSLSANATDSSLEKTLEPTTSTPAASKWASVASAGEGFVRTPNALNVSSGVTLWAIDNVANGLWSITDTLATAVPVTLASPKEGYQNPVNPVSGASQDISFSWHRPSAGTTSLAYEVKIYASDGTSLLTTATQTATAVATPNILVGPNQTTAGQTLSFAAGETYYWKVRVSSPVYSPYSETRSFSIAPLSAQVAGLLSPVNGSSDRSQTPSFSWSPVSGVTDYNFVLANNAGLKVPIVDVIIRGSTAYAVTSPLSYGTTYFWSVKPVAPIVGDWSAVGNFTVMAAPTAPTPPIVIEQTPAPIINIPAAPPAQQIIIPPAPPAPAPIAPGYIWAIIIIGAVLVIAVIVLIVRTRRAV